VKEALAEADLDSPTSIVSPSSTLLLTNGSSKQDPSVPDTPPPPNLFWTPFPNVQDGVPLGSVDKGGHMDITSILDSGIDGDWPQLNRDGFTVNMSGEDEAALWGVHWV
jgi:hypothetical protein